MRKFTSILVATALVGALQTGARAEKGLVQEVTRDSTGQAHIVIKDFRSKKPRALKPRQPEFREYDLGSAEQNYTPSQPPQAYTAAPVYRNVQYVSPAPRTVMEPVQTYSQTYAPGPNKSMSPGGGGSAFNSTVLPTAPVYGYPYYNGGYYPGGAYYPWWSYNVTPALPYRPTFVQGYQVSYPSTFPGFPPTAPGTPAAITSPAPSIVTSPPPGVRPLILPGPIFIRR